jgi:hypothetical protein
VKILYIDSQVVTYGPTYRQTYKAKLGGAILQLSSVNASEKKIIVPVISCSKCLPYKNCYELNKITNLYANVFFQCSQHKQILFFSFVVFPLFCVPLYIILSYPVARNICAIFNWIAPDIIPVSRSQWPRGLTHELSLVARTLGSWFRIPLKA